MHCIADSISLLFHCPTRIIVHNGNSDYSFCNQKKRCQLISQPSVRDSVLAAGDGGFMDTTEQHGAYVTVNPPTEDSGSATSQNVPSRSGGRSGGGAGWGVWFLWGPREILLWDASSQTPRSQLGLMYATARFQGERFCKTGAQRWNCL